MSSKKNWLNLIMAASVVVLASLYYTSSKNLENLTALVEDLENQVNSTSIYDFYPISENEREDLDKKSHSQLKQDVFAYLESNRKKNGFFVEFGATDGVSLSNSYMLEQDFGWQGILAEPALTWHEKLKNNRPNSKIETLCVWKESNLTLSFNETDSAALSTIEQYTDHDSHAVHRKKNNRKYEVGTISLLDLLKKYDAPQKIDYLSIDTEGSEFEILDAFFKDNNYYKIKIITVEHNHTDNREKIYRLLKKHGYQRKYQIVSQFDDFYVLQD